MSATPDGRFICDRDGADVGNGSVRMAVVVSDVDPDSPGMVRNLHFCRDREDEDGNKIKGCEHKILSPSNMKYHTEQKEKHDAAE